MKKLLYMLGFTFLSNLNDGQSISEANSIKIYEDIKKLNFLGSVLYVGAHPDDENTDLISFFSNSIHARTAYLSLTRGDGGQNLIGPELREQLGVIRTEELLEARKIDGGEQFFSRAKDFGFSKHPNETFEIWDKNQVLSDFVYVIRKFRPDVIINRFDHITAGNTHGHHTASAILSVEAFDVAIDKNKFPEQLKHFGVWQPKRLFFNDSWFFYGSQENFDKTDHTHFFKMNIGSYYSKLGKSNGEIAAFSRSKHSSQGFGAVTMSTRGPLIEYLKIIKGNKPEKNIFEGIDTSWSRIKGGGKIGKILYKIEKEFNFKNPSASMKDLLKADGLIQRVDNSYWKEIKSQEIKNIIINCAGLFIEAIAASSTSAPGESLKFTVETINRSDIPIRLKKISINEKNYPINIDLMNNKGIVNKNEIQIPENMLPSTPYWLNEKGTEGMYNFSDTHLTSLPKTPPPLIIKYSLNIKNKKIELEKPLIYKMNDKIKGEIYKPFTIVPKASVNIEEKVTIFSNGESRFIYVNVKSAINNMSGVLSLKAPEGWKIFPVEQSIKLEKKGSEKPFIFEVFPSVEEQTEGKLVPQLKIGNKIFEKQLVELNYNHISEQKVLLPGEAKIVRFNIQKKGKNIGYITGSGDSVPESLRQIGYNVEMITAQNISAEILKNYDAVVLGIRAFNVIPELKFKNKILFEYVNNGGNLIVQYNTTPNPINQLVTNEISPFPLSLSSERVTEENSKVIFLNPSHEVLNYPNKITLKDFEGWVQERGVYFPSKWGSEFDKILSINDKGQNPMEGGILIAKYGKGNYVYTSLSLFRQLPEGVSGSYRIFANLVSLGKNF